MVAKNDESLIPAKPLFRVSEVAEILGIPRPSVYSHIRCGALPAVKLGATVLIPRSTLLALLGEVA